MDAGVQPNAMDEASRWAFIVGAPRCGTTSLANYLGSHPQVCLSRPKEPHYFAMRDLRGHSIDELRSIVKTDYLDRFFPHRNRFSVLGEGSVTYLYAPERLEPVLRLWPAAKFIICLRNPLQMLPSLHQRHFVNGDETVKKFERAWAMVEDRRNGRHIPRSCLEPRFLDYWEAGNLGRHVQRFLGLIGRERCLISIFDDLEADAQNEYRRVLEFLDLPDDGQVAFERHAESRDCRIPWLQRLLQRPPKFAMSLVDPDDLHNPRFGESAGPLLRTILGLRTGILEWNEIRAERPTIDPAVLNEMRAMYAEDVALLSGLVGRDLSHWMLPEEAAVAAVSLQRGKELAS